jgi:hypothetical protein
MISIIVALIIGGLSLLGTIYTSKQQHSITIEEVKNEVSLIKKDIKNLEEKQDKHNSLIERVYNIEATLKVMDNREKLTEHRIDNLASDEQSHSVGVVVPMPCVTTPNRLYWSYPILGLPQALYIFVPIAFA